MTHPCPHCAGLIEFSEIEHGADVACPHCTASLRLPRRPPTIKPPPEPKPRRKPFKFPELDRWQWGMILLLPVLGACGWLLTTNWFKAHQFHIAVVIGITIAVLIYFIPATIARRRQHHNAEAIRILNTFLGWTVLGWIVALVWAHTKRPPK